MRVTRLTLGNALLPTDSSALSVCPYNLASNFSHDILAKRKGRQVAQAQESSVWLLPAVLNGGSRSRDFPIALPKARLEAAFLRAL